MKSGITIDTLVIDIIIPIYKYLCSNLCPFNPLDIIHQLVDVYGIASIIHKSFDHDI